ncbi:lysine -aminomutase [Lasius niger]|uniref:Lysine-aminomutase n=1 Tax=Lasius niger TaxID=67767 RepID=A0A0J7K0A8_LASNI|nr:lysine -aminomutase [Lasius niger]
MTEIKEPMMDYLKNHPEDCDGVKPVDDEEFEFLSIHQFHAVAILRIILEIIHHWLFDLCHQREYLFQLAPGQGGRDFGSQVFPAGFFRSNRFFMPILSF